MALAEILAKPTLVDIAAAEQALLNAQTTLENAKDSLAAARADLRNPANQQALESGQLERAIQSAELGLLIAQDNYDDVVAGPDATAIEVARLRLVTTQASLAAAQAQNDELQAAPEPQTILPLEAAVTQARSAVQNAAQDLRAATIVAPFDGLISEINVAAGDEINAATIAVVVINPNLLEIESDVDQSDIASLAVGQTAVVTFDALPGSSFMAEVSSVALTPEVTQGVVTFAVALTLSTEDVVPGEAFPAPGMTASVVITTQSVENALVVPSRALSSTGRQQTVTVRTAAGDEIRPVTTGTTNGTLTQVLSGLEPGDEVLVILATSTADQTQQTPQQQIPGGGFPGGGGVRIFPAP